MKKGVKIVLSVIGVVILIAIIAAIVVYSQLDSIVKHAIVKVGTETMQTKVAVDKVNISLTKGTAKITNLTIANPKSFSSNSAVKLGSISVDIDTGSVTQNPIILNKVDIESPHILFEVNKAGKVNLQVLQDNIKKQQQAGSTTAPTETNKPKSAEQKKVPADEKRFIIKDFDIVDPQVTFVSKSAKSADKGKPQILKLPNVHLVNMNNHGKGFTGAQIGQQVASVLISNSVKAVVKLGIGEAVKQIQKKMQKDIGNSLKSIFGN